MDIQKMRITDLNRAEYNPRVDLEPWMEEYIALKHAIEQFGLVQPVVWNKTTGNVVSGHQRLTVLQDMGETYVDVSIVELSEIQEKQLNVAMNKITGAWDDEKLADLLAELGDDATDTGFSLPEIEAITREMETFFDDVPVERKSSVEPDDTMLATADTDEADEPYRITLVFLKEDEDALKRYIQENGTEDIVEAIIAHIESL